MNHRKNKPSVKVLTIKDVISHERERLKNEKSKKKKTTRKAPAVVDNIVEKIEKLSMEEYKD